MNNIHRITQMLKESTTATSVFTKQNICQVEFQTGLSKRHETNQTRTDHEKWKPLQQNQIVHKGFIKTNFHLFY